MFNSQKFSQIRKYWRANWLALTMILLAGWFWAGKYRTVLFTTTDIALAGKKYATSQYVMGDASPEKITDATVYTYAASRYIAGESPTQVNFEHPPLGKYLLGLSWLLFKNVTVINLFLYLGSLWLFWNLSQTVIENKNWRLLALLLLSSLKLIPQYTFQSMLDIALLFATLLFFNSLFLVKVEKWRNLLVGASLGSYLSIKYFFPSAFLLFLILLIVCYQEKNLKFFFKTSLLALGFYLLSYVRYFYLHPNPLSFLKFEWFRWRWWTGNRTIPKFLLLDTLLTGKFKGWWAENEYEIATSWSKLWPISFFGWLASLLTSLKNLKNLETKLLAFFSVSMFLLYIFGSASNERYLIQLLPFWLMFFCNLIAYIYSYALSQIRHPSNQ